MEIDKKKIIRENIIGVIMFLGIGFLYFNFIVMVVSTIFVFIVMSVILYPIVALTEKIKEGK